MEKVIVAGILTNAGLRSGWTVKHIPKHLGLNSSKLAIDLKQGNAYYYIPTVLYTVHVYLKQNNPFLILQTTPLLTAL